MKTLAEKIKEARCALGFSQTKLGELTGVSLRSVNAYEKGLKKPREKTIYQLARALNVSVAYLKNDECENPREDIERDRYISEIREEYGSSGSRDIESMLADNRALFAGGELSQEEKDQYFDALMTAYVTCRETAKERFGSKKERDDKV